MRDKFYDGKKLFEWYCEAGRAATNQALGRWAEVNMPNPGTGKVSRMGPTYAMWSWAFDNPEEAYELWRRRDLLIHPDRIGSFESFLLILRNKGKTNPNISGGRKLIRFCQKYGLPVKFDVHIDDVIQVTKPSNALYQKLLFVARPYDSGVEAIILNEDGSHSVHQVENNQFGVVGKSLVGSGRRTKGDDQYDQDDQTEDSLSNKEFAS